MFYCLRYKLIDPVHCVLWNASAPFATRVSRMRLDHQTFFIMKYGHAYDNLFQEDQTYVADLEFAARIGKILLEQNKELEDHSRILQEKICDQDSKIMVWFESLRHTCD